MSQTSTRSSTLIVAGFHALSDPLRLKVVNLLRVQELCVCDLCEVLDVTQSKLSFHLKTLKTAQLVQARQQGSWVYYSLNLPQVIVLEQYLAELRQCGSMLPARACKDGAS
jgi:ArsR family transcriptional regulator, arsenate/arsenite/antimonite-responsive transcriptional repressor